MSHSATLPAADRHHRVTVRSADHVEGRWPVLGTVAFATVTSALLWSLIVASAYFLFF